MSGIAPITNPMTTAKTVPCQNCGNQIEVYQPDFYVHNGNETSCIVVPHEMAIVCGGCESVYRLEINRVTSNITLNLRCVRKSEPRIIGSNGSKLILPS
jgi:hypothetical protein